MEKLRGTKGPYAVSLDIGSKRIGFAAVTDGGDVLFHRGKPVMGTRVFKEAQHAADARAPRSQRRRIQRARGREREMERIFAPHIEPVDPDFITRRRNAQKVGKTAFDPENPAAWNYARDRAKFPTIDHAAVYLMETDEAADPRLIFEVIANNVVRRGHFLMEGQDISSKNSDITEQVETFAETLTDYYGTALDIQVDIDVDRILTVQKTKLARDLRDTVTASITEPEDSGKEAAARAKAIGNLIAGYKADLTAMQPDTAAKLPKVSVTDGDALAEFIDGSCPDELVPVVNAAATLYMAWRLGGMLSFAPGKTLSHNRVAQYDLYRSQLRKLKDLALLYVAQTGKGSPDPDGFARYCDFFGGPRKKGSRGSYSKPQVKKLDGAKRNMGYTAYDLNVISYDEFAKRVELLFEGTGAADDSDYRDMMEGFANATYLRRIHSTDAAAIPYQLHAEVVDRVIDNQGRFYPWLLDAKERILKVLTSRIPYYVGPLAVDNGTAEDGGTRFAWVERKPGHGAAYVTPWNYEDHIDTDATAERFIRRMTGECAYLDGEDVLPKNSLIYEKYCFLNELAGLSFTEDSDTWVPFDSEARRAVYDLAADGRKMTLRRIESLLTKRFGFAHPHVRGTSDPKAMSCRRANYAYFCKLLDRFRLTAADSSMVEDLILWNTVFEERDILRRKVAAEYGDILEPEAIDAFCAHRITGWGKLSAKLLTGIWVDTASGDMCVMDVLEDGRPYGRRGLPMNLMRILNDTELGFRQEIDRLNAERAAEDGSFDLNALPGSPALRRGVNQAMKVVADIASVAASAPARVYITVTRDATGKKQGKRTVKRGEAIKKSLKALDADAAASLDTARLLRELKMFDERDINERIYLYFHQCGKCAYTGTPLDISRIAGGDYHVDHIVPRAYCKNDSLDNKVLVLAAANERKSDDLLVPRDIQQKMAPFWRMLNHGGLMSDRKLSALMRTHVSEQSLKSVVSRQLTERSWEYKLLSMALAATYPGIQVAPVKSGIASQVRRRLGIPSCPQANRFDAARKALVSAELGRYIAIAAPVFTGDRVRYEQILRRVRESETENRKNPKSQLDFFASGFFFNRIDTETGEVLWDAKAERERVRGACDWNNLRVTFMPYEDGGAYWNQTVYSPEEKSRLIPLKEDLDPAVYGGYSSQQFSFFFIYRVDTEKGTGFRFAGVPASIVHAQGGTVYAKRLELYARSLAETAGEKFVDIFRDRILKDTVIEIAGERYRIAGEKAVYPVRQLPMKTDDLKKFSYIAALARNGATPRMDMGKTIEGIETIWETLLDIAPHCFPKSAAQLHLADLTPPTDIIARTPEAKLPEVARALAETEVEIVELLSGQRCFADTKMQGGAKNAGVLSFRFNKVLNDSGANATLIDISPAGLYEKRQKIG